VYFLRLTSLGRGQDASMDDIGTWAVDQGKLTLRGGREAPIQFSIEDERTLRKLDTDGRAMQSSLPHDLTRTDALQTLEPRLQLRGMYMYMADAGNFRECLTGKRWPVAMEAANAALERAYGEARNNPGDEVLAGVEGRIAMRPKMEGEGLQPTLVVERVVGVWPGKTCPQRAGDGPMLENTTWKLTQVLGVAVPAADPKRAPQILLQSDDHRVLGSGGCNRLAGGYTLDGASLKFSGIAATKMACPDMATENAFLKALDQVATWKVTGGKLELADAQGTVLLRFESRPAG
jgi:copper homeostasis protein (lipoprotein)